jgi:SAM-dependent methyltransferase
VPVEELMTTRGFPIWDELYREQAGESLPWYYAQLDPDLERALSQLGIQSGRVLDLGSGSGSQAQALAALGFDVTGSDLSQAAVEQARARAGSSRQQLQFVQDDILNTRLPAGFDWVFDRGCFHVFAPEMRGRYVATLAALIPPPGLLFLKCFSDEQPGEVGPYKFSPDQIQSIFDGSFDVLSIERSVYQGNFVPAPRALFCALRRKA